MRTNCVSTAAWTVIGFLMAAAAGCTTKHYRSSADAEAKRVIAQKAPAVPNMQTNFSIQPFPLESLDDLPVVTNREESLGVAADREIGARMLSLERALDLAVKHNRTYQSRKEVLYLRALGLTLARHQYTPLFSGGAKGTYTDNAAGARMTNIVGQTTNVVDRIVRARSVNVGPNVRADWLLRTGGRLAASFTADFFRFIGGDPRWATSSQLAASFTQPLLRGAGYRVAMENLTQAERDLLYGLRDFVQYRREFSVQIASAYYDVLQTRDRARNSWLGFQNFKQNVERTQAYVDEGKKTPAELGRLKQAEISNEGDWVNAVRAYTRGLDQFKILLGLPIETPLVLDDRELQKLRIVHPQVNLDDLVKLALVSRLDLQSTRDRYEDAARRIKVVSNGLLPKVDLLASVDVSSQPGKPFTSYDFRRYSWSLGADIDLPLNNKAQRNAYRGALIDHESAARELALAIDQVKLDVTDGWRSLDQAKRSYEISEVGVSLSERRVEEQELLTELGRGTAKDLVDARTDLINARNDRTRALIGHVIARLQFWRNVGILTIKDNGLWEEVSDANAN